VSPAEVEAIVARNLDSSPKHVREMTTNLDRRDVSLDAPLTVDAPDTRVTMLVGEPDGSEEELVRLEREQIVRETVSAIEPGLPPRERYVLRHRLLSDEPERLVDIGHRFGVSRERVRQIELRLKKTLRKALAELAPQRQAA
jgi:RNA polymerase sigma-32 factor